MVIIFSTANTAIASGEDDDIHTVSIPRGSITAATEITEQVLGTPGFLPKRGIHRAYSKPVARLWTWSWDEKHPILE